MTEELLAHLRLLDKFHNFYIHFFQSSLSITVRQFIDPQGLITSLSLGISHSLTYPFFQNLLKPTRAEEPRKNFGKLKDA